MAGAGVVLNRRGLVHRAWETGMVTSDDGANLGRGLRYADHRPYPDPPEHLVDLTGPTAGRIELPLSIDWGPKRSYDMAADADRRAVYEVVLQEAVNAVEIARYVNGAALVEVWPRLWLPQQVRQRWETRFAELTSAAQRWTSSSTGSCSWALNDLAPTDSPSPAVMPFKPTGWSSG
jgi:hypothetical protein